MNDYKRFWPGQVFHNDVLGIRHGIFIIAGGYFHDDELAVCCSGTRHLEDKDCTEGIPNCLACWAKILA